MLGRHVAWGLVALGVARSAHADEMATSAARPNYEATEKALMWDARENLERRGLTIDGTYSVDLFAAPQLDNGFVAGGLFTLEVDVLHRGHLSAFAIHGDGVTAELMDLHGVSGNTATPGVRLFEAWVDQPLGPLTLRGGLLSVDQEFVVADASSLLLGATFGIISQFSANALGPVYPVAAPGVSARLELARITGRLAVYDASLANDHGIPTQLGPASLVVGEAQLDATFKLGGWHHSERGDAVYAVVDASVLPWLGTFARAGYSPDGPVSTYIDTGFRAIPRGRPGDLMSVGLAFAHAVQGAETAVELTYEAQVHWLSIQPDAQLVFMHERTVAVMTLRMTVTL